MEYFKFSLGIIAGILSLLAYSIYIYTSYKGTTKPNVFTWAVLTINGLLILITYGLGGAFNTIWVALSYVVGPLAIVCLAFRNGERKWGKTETISVIGIVISLIVWIATQSPFLGLALNILVDFFALLPTLEKTVWRPWTEDRIAWSVTLVSCLFNIFAIEKWTIEIALYPLYLLLVDGFIAIYLIWHYSTKSSGLRPKRSK